jgi:MoxR-like ATPase
MTTQTEQSVTTQEIEAARATVAKLAARLRAAIKGRDDVIELITVGLLADGHVLLEDYPGSGKTTLARALGESIVEDSGTSEFAPFRRIQFTPDLLPSDITGTSVFSPETGSFSFRPGPLFSHVVLADEINRTSPKVQAALLEAMAEKQVTSDNATHKLDDLFFVIATQNPLDVAGTYPLPTPQLDRFLFKIAMKHIARDAELELLAQYPVPPLSNALSHPPVTRSEILAARRAVRHGVLLAPPMRQALVDFARALRADPRVLQGASTRSIMLAMPALQARALGRGRTWTSPEDLEALVPHVFRHRIELSPGVDDADAILRECLAPTLDALAKESMRR